MTRLLRWLWVLLIPGGPANGQVVRIPMDSSIARAAAPAIVQELRFLIARAAFTPDSGILKLEFPDSLAPDSWRQLREHLLLSTRSRQPRMADSVWWYARLDDAALLGERLSIQFTVGHTRVCPGSGVGSYKDSFRAVYTRVEGHPWQLQEVAHFEGAHGMSCESIREWFSG